MKQMVLVVDDDPEIRNLLKEALSTMPYTIMTTASAEEALTILTREPIDAIIADEIMPGMSGSEFLAIVRQKYPDIIRMVLTGQATLESAIRAINEGEVYRFFIKPCSIVDLAITIRHALQQRDLVKKTQRLLRMVKLQSSFIDQLERKYPGITAVKKDTRGRIIIDGGDDSDNFGNLIEEINQTLKKCEAYFTPSTFPS